ncbi:MAG: amino acid permease [Candidatus Bathyarchaeia archaeon]
MTSRPPPLFVREATGIVRSFSPFDTFMFTTFGISYGVSLALSLVTIPAVLPGANIAVALVAVIPFVLALGLLYAWFTEAMPRSGGDYVWISRALHPALALGLSIVWVFFQASFIGAFTGGFLLTSIVGAGLGTLGLLIGNAGLIASASYFANNNVILLLGTLIILLMFVMLIFPLKVYLRIQQASWILGMISVLIFFYIFGTTSHAQFVSTFNTYFGAYNATYTGIISSAQSAGFSNPGLVTFGAPTALCVVYAVFLVNGYQMGGYIGGELKNAKKAMYYSSIIGSIAICLVLAAGGFQVQQVMGADFMNAVAFVSGAGTYPVPFPFNAYFLAILLGNNAVLGALLFIGLLAWSFVPNLVAGIILSRTMMSWGFDRSAPPALAYVNDRLHIPVVGVIVYTILAELGLLASIYFGFIFSVLNFTLVLLLLFACVGLAGMVYPYRRKDLFELTPLARRKIGNIPAMSLLGAAVLVIFSILAYFTLSYPALSGPVGATAVGLVAGVFLIGVAIYYANRTYYKRKGLNIDAAFAVIPPE